MIKNMRQAECVVNYNIAVAIGKGTVLANDRTLLRENGGSLNLDLSWCQSVFWRIGFTNGEQLQQNSLCLPVFLKR